MTRPIGVERKAARVDSVQAYLNHVERDDIETLSDERARENGYLAASLVAWHEWSYRAGSGS